MNKQQRSDCDWCNDNRTALYEKYGAGWAVIHNQKVRAMCQSYKNAVQFAEEFLGYLPEEYVVVELVEPEEGRELTEARKVAF